MRPRRPYEGSHTHLRYDHVAGPTVVALVCPRCGGLAEAVLPAATRGRKLIGDTTEGFRDPWSIRCTACPHAADDVTREELRRLPLYFSRVVAGVELWAYNREHLAMIADRLEGQPIDHHPYAWLASYLPRAWLRRAARFAKAARLMLAG